MGKTSSFPLSPAETLGRDAGPHSQSSCRALSDLWGKPRKLGKFLSVFIKCEITWRCGPGSATARDWGYASCATDIIQDTEWHGLGVPPKASYFCCGSKGAEHTWRSLHVSDCHPHFQPETRRSPQPRRDPAPPFTQIAGHSRRPSIRTDAAGWTRACNLKLKPSEAFFFLLSFTGKRQDTRCTLSRNNNDRQNRRILIGFATEADKRGEQQRKQYYTILRTINHLLV